MDAGPDFELVVRHFFPGATLHGAQPLTGGVSAQVHRLDLSLGGGSKSTVVLRVHGDDPHALSADREFALLRAAYDAGVPVPRPFGVDADGQLLDRPCVLMPFVEGTTDFVEASRCIDAMAEALASIHALPPRSLPALPERRDPLPETIGFLPDGEEWHALRGWLQRQTNTAFEGTATLLHGDFWPGNVLWRDGRIAAILDWEDAAIGDPMSDVAGACLELRYDHGVGGAARFLEAYQAHMPVDPNRLALWQIYVASAAQRFMGRWGLDPDREAHMRRVALQSIREAGSLLLA